MAISYRFQAVSSPKKGFFSVIYIAKAVKCWTVYISKCPNLTPKAPNLPQFLSRESLFLRADIVSSLHAFTIKDIVFVKFNTMSNFKNLTPPTPWKMRK